MYKSEPFLTLDIKKAYNFVLILTLLTNWSVEKWDSITLLLFVKSFLRTLWFFFSIFSSDLKAKQLKIFEQTKHTFLNTGLDLIYTVGRLDLSSGLLDLIHP